MEKKKPTPGHKFQGAQIGAVARCECGWKSATWFGKGCQSNAIGEWHQHIEKCAPAKGDTP